MMLKNLRTWVARRVSGSEPPNRGHGPEAAKATRENRAALVVALQAEVRTLQQEIADLTTAWDTGTDQSDRGVATARLRALETALEQKQGELSKIQGRI
jgi:hypothetical protein